MKRIVCFVLVLMILSGLLVNVSAQSDIKIFLNGDEIKTDVPPQLINDRTMVPLRFIFEALDCVVLWDDETHTATGKRTGTEINITIGENTFLRNGKVIPLDSPAIVIDGRTLVPVRAIAESFNCRVEWDGENSYVLITTKELKFAVCPDFPPFAYKDEKGYIVGYDMDLALKIATEMECMPVFNEYKNISQALDSVKNGESDMAVSGLPYRSDWLDELSSSTPYYVSKQIIVTNQNSQTDVNNLKGKTIGVLENTVSETYIKEAFNSKRIRTYITLDEAFDALSKVEIACIIADENLFSGKTDNFRVCEEAYITEEYVIYLSEDSNKLLQEVNSIIENMKK